MIGPQGMREIGVNTRRGRKVLKAGKDGLFDVGDNTKLAKKLKDEGLGVAGIAPVGNSVVGYPCECGFA